MYILIINTMTHFIRIHLLCIGCDRTIVLIAMMAYK